MVKNPSCASEWKGNKHLLPPATCHLVIPCYLENGEVLLSIQGQIVVAKRSQGGFIPSSVPSGSEPFPAPPSSPALPHCVTLLQGCDASGPSCQLWAFLITEFWSEGRAYIRRARGKGQGASSQEAGQKMCRLLSSARGLTFSRIFNFCGLRVSHLWNEANHSNFK